MTTPKGVHSYLYDKIYQLTKADYPSGSSFSDTNYSFDAVANRTVAGSTAYIANELNQYSKVGNTSYSYDGNGNLTNDGKNTYLYDYENRLVQAKTASDTVTFKYDGFGRRTAKSSSGKTTAYLYDGDQILAEYDESGNLLRKFVYGTRIDEPIVIENGGNQYFYHADGLGSVTEITDSSGAVAEKYEYDVYGKPVIKDGSEKVLAQSALGNSYLFTGREYDADTGLYYYRARYYSPDLGRFLQTDPVDYLDSMNLYGYCINNPVNFTDPTGKILPLIGMVVGGAIVGAVIGGIFGGKEGAIKGAIAGAVGGLTFGVGGPIIASIVGEGILAGALGGAFSGAAGDLAAQGYGILTGSQCDINLWELGTATALGGFLGGIGGIGRGGKEVVQRAMSRAELEATIETGLLRGGREGNHYVSDAVNTIAQRAQQRLALPVKPEVRVTLEVPKGRFSPPSRVQPYEVQPGKILPGGGMERIATGDVPVRILDIFYY